MKYFDLMNEACEKIGVPFDEDNYNKFILYKKMLQQWNEKVNLTAITEDKEIIKKHFIDCIKCYSFSKVKDAETIIDIGTGAGFPGIPIGIIDNSKKIVLLDSLNKRVTFLNEVIKELNLNNITAYHGRAEEYIRSAKCREVFDVAISRAVANMTVLSELCIPYVRLKGYFVAMKGPSVEEELNDAKNAISTLGGLLENVVEIEIEDSDLKHNLVVIKKIKKTPDIYPRKAGTAVKKPIK